MVSDIVHPLLANWGELEKLNAALGERLACEDNSAVRTVYRNIRPDDANLREPFVFAIDAVVRVRTSGEHDFFHGTIPTLPGNADMVIVFAHIQVRVFGENYWFGREKKLSPYTRLFCPGLKGQAKSLQLSMPRSTTRPTLVFLRRKSLVARWALQFEGEILQLGLSRRLL